MRTLKTSEAAEMLSVSPNTLRAWERRFNYPRPQRTAGQHRAYIHAEVVALRDALQAGLSISSAVSRAREALSGDTAVLVGSLEAFETERADAAMEATLALRAVERSVEEVLLPALDEIVVRHGADSAAWAIAARWGDGWLRRAHRLAPPPTRPMTILIGDATRDALDPAALSLRAFELFCVRSGARVVTLPVRCVAGIGDVVPGFDPQVVVIAGDEEADDDVARWAYQVRLATGAIPVLLFRRGGQEAGIRSTAALPDTPFDAHRQALSAADEPVSHPRTTLPSGRFSRTAAGSSA